MMTLLIQAQRIIADSDSLDLSMAYPPERIIMKIRFSCAISPAILALNQLFFIIPL